MFYLADKPVHNRRETLSLRVEQRSIGYDGDCSGPEGHLIGKGLILLNIKANSPDSRRISQREQFSVNLFDHWLDRVQILVEVLKDLVCFVHVG